MIDPGHNTISIARQCELVGLPRSSYYYQEKGEDAYSLHLMRLIDEQYTRRPILGVRRMTDWLRRHGHMVNHKRVARLMRLMGLEAIYPKPKTSLSHKQHRKYPYLLRDLAINQVDQVWCTDVTYIRLHAGFVYLTAIMDWHSRYVLTWQLSNTLDTSFCLDALSQALDMSKPEIFNSDQGVQFTSNDFTGLLESQNIRISMDGKGRCFDNIMVERLWRSLKYEEVYLKEYRSLPEARRSIDAYFAFYNQERPHQSHDYRTPFEVYHNLEWGACVDSLSPHDLLTPSLSTSNHSEILS